MNIDHGATELYAMAGDLPTSITFSVFFVFVWFFLHALKFTQATLHQKIIEKITIGCIFLKRYLKLFEIADMQSIKQISTVSHMGVLSSVNYIEITYKLLVEKLFRYKLLYLMTLVVKNLDYIFSDVFKELFLSSFIFFN